MESYRKLRKVLKGRVLFREPLSRHTTFCIGGPADAWVEPEDYEDLKRVVLFARKNKIKIFTIGKGSNILASDKGFSGLVVSLSSPRFSDVFISERTVRAGAGAGLGKVVHETLKRGLSGIEGLAGIPGSVGAAVIMNAGYKSTTGQHVCSVKVMDKKGNISVLKPGDFKFSYRKSNLSCYIVLEVDFLLEKGIRKKLQLKYDRFMKLKKESQPLNKKSAGCVFRNPPRIKNSAACLIENCGLKGTAVGGAMISKKHANFIINNKSAKSEDVECLISLVRKNVKKKFNVSLKPELVRLGS